MYKQHLLTIFSVCRKFSMNQNLDVSCSEFRLIHLHGGPLNACSNCRSNLEVFQFQELCSPAPDRDLSVPVALTIAACSI